MKEINKARKKWEKIMKKKMSEDEFTMFTWGYVYAICSN